MNRDLYIYQLKNNIFSYEMFYEYYIDKKKKQKICNNVTNVFNRLDIILSFEDFKQLLSNYSNKPKNIDKLEQIMIKVKHYLDSKYNIVEVLSQDEKEIIDYI